MSEDEPTCEEVNQYEMALDEIDRLRAENARLRAALEAAPTLQLSGTEALPIVTDHDLHAWTAEYLNWYITTRAEALKGSQ